MGKSSVLREPSLDKSGQAVARPLRELVPLIEQDLAQGREAAERASLPYYRAAGEKLLEAKSQVAHGAFQDWVTRNFQVSSRMARHYMRLAEETATQKGNAFPFSSLNAFIRQTRSTVPPPPRLKAPPTGEQTRALHRTLALKLIDRGYKALAQELHPDHAGGSEEMMKHLHMVRDRLKHSVLHVR